jgi:hypothetical protein
MKGSRMNRPYCLSTWVLNDAETWYKVAKGRKLANETKKRKEKKKGK